VCAGAWSAWCQQEELKQKQWKKTIRVAVSGAAGMISNHLLFKLASGRSWTDQPIALNLLGSDRSKEALEGTFCATLTTLA